VFMAHTIHYSHECRLGFCPMEWSGSGSVRMDWKAMIREGRTTRSFHRLEQALDARPKQPLRLSAKLLFQIVHFIHQQVQFPSQIPDLHLCAAVDVEVKFAP